MLSLLLMHNGATFVDKKDCIACVNLMRLGLTKSQIHVSIEGGSFLNSSVGAHASIPCILGKFFFHNHLCYNMCNIFILMN